MVSLQTVLIAEEMQKDAQRRAEQARLLKLLSAEQVRPVVNFGWVAGWLRSPLTVVMQTISIIVV